MPNQPLKNHSDEAIAQLLRLRLPDDVQQQAAIEILGGKPLDVALRHARAEVARQLRPSGWSSLDEVAVGAAPLLDRIAAPEHEELEHWRTAQLDTALEALCASLAVGTAALGRAHRFSRRRAQQLVAAQICRAQQGDLFGGEVA